MQSVFITLLYTANFERYRNCYLCPLPGCPSTRAIKKLSNHLVQVHCIHDRRERAKVLKQAKDIGPQAPQRRKVSITINEAFSRVRQRSSYLVEPKIQERQGKTNSWARFHSTTPILAEFADNLTSFDGGAHKIDEATQIVTDVSKYLAFAYKSHARWSSLTEVEKLKSYITKLNRVAIGPDGVTTKIDRLITSINYTTREKLISREEALEAKDRLCAWKCTIKKQKTTKALARTIKQVIDDTALSRWNAVRNDPQLLVSE